MAVPNLIAAVPNWLPFRLTVAAPNWLPFRRAAVADEEAPSPGRRALAGAGELITGGSDLVVQQVPQQQATEVRRRGWVFANITSSPFLQRYSAATDGHLPVINPAASNPSSSPRRTPPGHRELGGGSAATTTTTTTTTTQDQEESHSSSPSPPQRPLHHPPSGVSKAEGWFDLDLALLACSANLMVGTLAEIKDVSSSWGTAAKAAFGGVSLGAIGSLGIGLSNAGYFRRSQVDRRKRILTFCARLSSILSTVLFTIVTSCEFGRVGCVAGVFTAVLIATIMAICWVRKESSAAEENVELTSIQIPQPCADNTLTSLMSGVAEV